MAEEYSVESIAGWRYNLRKKCREFYIKWLNYDSSDNTWEPESYLNCPEILAAFIKTLSPVQENFYFSPEPSKLTGFQRNAAYLGVVGADGPHDSDDEDSEKPKALRQNFYCLVRFEDSDYAEEVTIKEFFLHKPKEAFEFLENRVLVRDRIEMKVPKKVHIRTNSARQRA